LLFRNWKTRHFNQWIPEKDSKTPRKEIKLALKLKSDYEKQKPDNLRGT
jgi:hypothetical protein